MPQPELPPLIAFGAHPDDVEFGVGGVIARETRLGRLAHIVVTSRGEAASHGTPETRTAEAQTAAQILGASLEFLDLAPDGQLAPLPQHALRIASVIRRLRPAIVLAPTPGQNQHPDHAALAKIVRDATRLARYAGLPDLRDLPPHSIDHLLFYAVTFDDSPGPLPPILIDCSDPTDLAKWTAAMQAHASQSATRNYVDLQLTRAKLHGARANLSHAIPLYPNDPLVCDSLSSLRRGARHF